MGKDTTEKEANREPQSLHDKGSIEKERKCGYPAFDPDMQGSGSGQVSHTESGH